MTSDAKIGLLLGLVFIFLIAFIINGLPSFNNDKDNNELTLRIVNPQSDRVGLAAKERKANFEVINPTEAEVVRPIVPVEKASSEARVTTARNGGIRFETPLPKKLLDVKKTEVAKGTKKGVKTAPNKAVLPKVYVVEEGDSLAIIAKKFYGGEEGNKAVNVSRIYEANRRNLKSADEIYVGQKLVIPLLRSSARDKSKIESIFSPRVFEKVESIGKRYLWVEQQKEVQSKRYVVREGDSLWRIAAEKLGDGNRYREIAKLNTDILEYENSLAVGMQLKIPVR
jgi:nucleoid-associated protein YgaU